MRLPLKSPAPHGKAGLHFVGSSLRLYDAWRRAFDTLDELGHPDAVRIRARLNGDEHP